MKPEKISLYFREGTSDKVYHVQLETKSPITQQLCPGEEGWVVNFQYGRRNAKLTEGTKTPNSLPYADALKIYDKLVAEKIGKGYQDTSDGAAPTTVNLKSDDPLLSLVSASLKPKSNPR